MSNESSGNAQTRQSLRCSRARLMDVDEGSGKQNRPVVLLDTTARALK